MLTSEKLKKEIKDSGLSRMDEEALFWYLSICKSSSQWMAFAGCDWRNGKRRWFATDSLIKLTRGLN